MVSTDGRGSSSSLMNSKNLQLLDAKLHLETFRSNCLGDWDFNAR
ncbi:MAG: hypothetical protein WBD58_01735 [Geitlerinemataceae cyanobacterium]